VLVTLIAVWAILATGPGGLTQQPVANQRPNLEKTQGEVRVILLRVGNVIASNQKPGFGVTFAIEVPQQGAFSDLSIRSNEEVALAVNGRPVKIPGASSSGSMGIDKLPRQHELVLPTVPKGRATLGEQVEFEGLTIDAKKIDVTIRFSWRKQEMTFAFKDVPVR
jgi:hypothetical protein